MLKHPIAAMAVSAMLLSACGTSADTDNAPGPGVVGLVFMQVFYGAAFVLDIADKAGLLPEGPERCAVTFVPQQKVLLVQQDCLFADGRSRLNKDVNLKGIADFLLRYPNNRYDVVIYTEEPRLSAAENLKLSKQRANAVVQELRNLGVPASRLSASGRGEFPGRDQNIAPYRVYFVIRPLQ